MKPETRFSFPSIRRAVVAALAIACAAPLPADVLFLEKFETPDVPSYAPGTTPSTWLRAAQGYASGDHGLTGKSGGDFAAAAGNNQAYTFRYTDSGIATAEKALGSPLAFSFVSGGMGLLHHGSSFIHDRLHDLPGHVIVVGVRRLVAVLDHLHPCRSCHFIENQHIPTVQHESDQFRLMVWT